MKMPKKIVATTLKTVRGYKPVDTTDTNISNEQIEETIHKEVP